jgi:1-acyl-sn-glycerol-3-phosphate acyltransferase
MLLRSIVFKTLFYSLTAIYVILLSVTFLWPNHRGVYRGITLWSDVTVWMLKTIVGIDVEIRGTENLPDKGPYIVAPKHESTIDAFLAIKNVPDATALAKKEIFYFPILGFLLLKLNVIPVNRQKGNAHKKLPSVGDLIMKSKRPILVFPEGTRVPIGKRLALKPGAYFLQEELKIPVFTSATNAAFFWPSDSFLMKKGKIVWEIHPAMPTGLNKDAFMKELEKQIIGQSEVLKDEARRSEKA